MASQDTSKCKLDAGHSDSDSSCIYIDSSSDEELGKTPLMLACEAAKEDAVRRLLAKKGTEVNATCEKWGNTALHYACIDTKVMYVRTRQMERRVRTRKTIVEMLMKQHAVYKQNKHGMTPIFYAGLHKMRELVELLGDHKAVKKVAPSDEKIKGIEFLGLSNAIYGPQILQAYDYLQEAKIKRKHCRAPPGPSLCPELEEIFGCSETKTLEGLEEIKSEERELVIEGYLIGGRIFPKLEFPWNTLFGYALEKLEKRKMDMSVCRNLLCLAMEREVGRQMYADLFLDELNVCLPYKGGCPGIYTCMADVMEAFLRGLDDADVKWIKCKRRTLTKKIATILYRFVTFSNGDGAEPLLAVTEKIFMRLYNPKHRRRQGLSSGCVWHILSLFLNDVSLSDACQETFRPLKQMFARLMALDGVRYVEDGVTMLHQLVDAVIVYNDHANDMKYQTIQVQGDLVQEAWQEFILWLIKMAIRHGCPIEAKNSPRHAIMGSKDGMTAKEWFLLRTYCWDPEEQDLPPWQSKLLQHLSASTAVLSLAELASRTILRWNISYREVIPRVLCDFVSGVNGFLDD